MNSVPTTNGGADGLQLVVGVAGLVLLILLAIGLSTWMKRLQVPYAARAVVVILAGILLPVVVIVGLGFFWVHETRHVVIPAQERATEYIPDAVALQLPVPIEPHDISPPTPAEAFSGQIGLGEPPVQFRQQSRSMATKSMVFGGFFILAPVLVIVAIAIGVHVWLRQRGKPVSVGAMIVAGASLLWLLPILAVLGYVGLKLTAVAPTQASHWQPTYDTFNAHPSQFIAESKQQVEMVKQRAQEARLRGLAAAEAGRAVAREQAKRLLPQATVSEPQPLGTEPVTQIPPGIPIVFPNVSEPQPLGTEPVPQTPPVTAEKPKASQPQASPVPEAVPSEKQPIVPSPLPDWVTKGTIRDGDKILAVVSSKQFSQVDEARADAMAQAKVIVTSEFHARYPQSQGWTIPELAVHGVAVQESFVEAVDREVTTSGTPFRMYRVHLQLESSDRVNQTILPLWNQEVAKQRLGALVAVGVLLTLIFATTSAYLSLDDWTKGAYRGRLRLAAVSLIVAGGLITTVFV